MTRQKNNIVFLIVLISMAIAVVIINLNTASLRFSRLDSKILESFALCCDRLLEEELPKGTKSREIPADRVQFTPEIHRFRPKIVKLSPDYVWVSFREFRFAVTFERDPISHMEWKLTLFDETRSRVLLRRPKSKNLNEPGT